ncbi:NAD-dependent epimerase/dehydratase family protein [Algibacter miyuki]|uniref:NAD-dependent epimerase/dehydratase family protein n=1 Tax=Algibacter miyuki TaxID=1306933 RepID=A0ABV5GZJ1_9FLAO|nr:NAD(P)-dependent oxidoreductase [Algibacter miyuki]MDN3667150.1 NAD(P)-dependent oxidoreductase [Algibacter miyuki]
MRIIVTGGSGFIGNKLVEQLKLFGHKIIVIDLVKPKSDVEYIIFDISNPKILDQNFGKIDYIFHIAAQSGGYFSLKNSYEDCLWNSVGTLNIVKLAQKLKVKKIVYTSTMAVYGNAKDASELSPPNPISFYGASKLSAEFYVKLLKEHNSIPYTIFRLFATYGGTQNLLNDHQGILSIYLNQALKGNVITITGAKNRTRELIHVNDVIKALSLSFKEITDNEIYNVTFKENLTPEIIIDKISQRLGKNLKIKEVKGYLGDQTYITGNNEKLKTLGWSADYDLEKGLNEFINYLEV